MKNLRIGQSAAESVRKGSTTRSQDPRVPGQNQRFRLKVKGCTYDRYTTLAQMNKYLDSIISIRDKVTDKSIYYKTITIDPIVAKYSNTKTPIYKLVIDGKPISRNNTLVVKYTCITCNAQQEITLNLYIRKINKEGTNCVLCVNQDENKRTTHSNFMIENSKEIIKGTYINTDNSKKSLDFDDYLELSSTSWMNEDDDFKNQYFLKHLTIDDFERIRPFIIGIGNEKIKNISEWKYFPYYRIWNQTRYTPIIINPLMKTIDKLKYITFECQNCNSHFINRDIEIQKNHIKIFCKDCSFSNRTFSIKNIILKNGNKILWQSIPERRFIEWCDENNIAIKNGPTIEYFFENNVHKYKVDFELPTDKLLLEIKDNHIWHKNQVTSGKFSKKEECAKKWCVEHNYKYILAFPKTMSKLKELLLKKTPILEDIV